MGLDSRNNFKTNGLDTLRLSDKQWANVMSEIEAATPTYDGGERRRDSRRRYKKHLRVIVRVEHPGGSNMTFAVRSRDISAMGVGFLHGSFLYPGTPCSVVLPALDGRMFSVKGTIVRCRLLQGKLHEVGVEFTDPIELQLFIADLDTLDAAAARQDQEEEPEESIFRKKKPPAA